MPSLLGLPVWLENSIVINYPWEVSPAVNYRFPFQISMATGTEADMPEARFSSIDSSWAPAWLLSIGLVSVKAFFL